MIIKTFQLIGFPLLQALMMFILILFLTLPTKCADYKYVFKKAKTIPFHSCLPLSAPPPTLISQQTHNFGECSVSSFYTDTLLSGLESLKVMQKIRRFYLPCYIFSLCLSFLWGRIIERLVPWTNTYQALNQITFKQKQNILQ